jgi:GMP synthase-like glutamine amidotransferase
MTTTQESRTIPGLDDGSILYVSATVHPTHPLHGTFRSHVDPAPSYDLGRALKSVGPWIRRYFSEHIFDGTTETLPKDLSRYQGVVVGCSLHFINPERAPIEPWQQGILDLIKRAVHDYDLPFLGMCGGGQLGLVALGGRVGPNPAGVGLAPAAGSAVVRTTDLKLTECGKRDPIFEGCDGPLSMVAIHSDYLAEAPASAGFSVLAHSDDIPNQVIAWGEKVRLFGVHPEMSSDFVRTMARNVVETGAFGPYPRQALYDAVARMGDTSNATNHVLPNFLAKLCANVDADHTGKRAPMQAEARA